MLIGTNIDNGLRCRVYWNQATCAYLSFYFFIFLSLQFLNIKTLSSHFSQELRGLQSWNLVHMWIMC